MDHLLGEWTREVLATTHPQAVTVMLIVNNMIQNNASYMYVLYYCSKTPKIVIF